MAKNKILDKSYSTIEQAKVDIEGVRDAWTDTYEEKSEKWKESEAGEAFNEKLEGLNEALDQLQEALDKIDEVNGA